MAYLDQFLAQAYQLEEDPNARMDPGVIARMDQTKARNEEVDREVAKILGTSPSRVPRLRAQALAIAIGVAAQRLQPRLCPHVDRSRPPALQDIRVNLSFKQAGCIACHDQFVIEHVAKHGIDPVSTDDDRCDLCDTPSDAFREVNCQWGVAHVSMNICDECFDWLHPDLIQRFPR